MKKYLFILLAAIAIVACSDDEEPKMPDPAEAIKTLRGDYLGALNTDSRVNDALKCRLEGVHASLSDSLSIAIPLELVAEQIVEYDVWSYTAMCHAGYVTVNAAVENLHTDNDTIHFALRPDSICLSYTTSTFQQAPSDSYRGLKLTFSDNCSGEYSNSKIQLNLCIEEMRIENQLIEVYKPQTFHFEGSKDLALTDGRHIQQLNQTLQGRWRAQTETAFYGKKGFTNYYDYRYLVYEFDGENFTYEDGTKVLKSGHFDVVWHQWGNELHTLNLSEGNDLFPNTSYKFEMTEQTLLLLWTENGFEKHVLRLLKETE